MNASVFRRGLPVMLFITNIIIGISTVNAGIAPAPFVEPAEWQRGRAGATSQTWDDFAVSIDTLDGAPDVSFDDAGGELAAPVVSVASPGFIAGSGNPYSFAGSYGITAEISNHQAGLPAGAGTHVIVQTFATINEDDGEGNAGTILGAVIGNAPSAELLRFDTYAYAEDVPSSFGPVSVQATIHEFWLPDYTGDFDVLLDVITHSSFDQLRIDTQVANSAPDGGSPFAITPVPEPASLALLGVGTALLAFRRR